MDIQAAMKQVLTERNLKIGTFVRLFNEQLGPAAISRQTGYNWAGGKRGSPYKFPLIMAMQVYAPDDWRHRFAVAVLENGAHNDDQESQEAPTATTITTQ